MPRTFVLCTGDGAVPIDPHDDGWDNVEITSGHWPMLTEPQALAEVLAALASQPRQA